MSLVAKPIVVSLGLRSYPIFISDSYKQLPTQLSSLSLSKQGWVVSHPRLLRRYARALLGPLQDNGWTLHSLCVPESESSKSLAMARRLTEALSHQARMHVPVLFAFGGGVIGDLAGFVAAVFRRGIPYVQLPTTLLAQVDSAIGGKVGVDLPFAKNLVGCFYQPRLVYNHLGILQSLPWRQRQSGLAEIIKYGVIADPRLFSFLEKHLEECLSLQAQALQFMVARSCAIKAQVVSRDEREVSDLRAHLNFGHTLGHALEAATHYRRWTHGEAIAIGMCAAAHISVQLKLLPESDFQRLAQLIRRAGLPTVAENVDHRCVLQALEYDKKFIHGRPRWVLPTRIGKVVVTENVPDKVVRRVLANYLRTGKMRGRK